jgi:hypothetical protein
MAVTITRYGGMIPTLMQSKIIDLNALDGDTRDALDTLAKGPPSAATPARMPDAFTYGFEWDEGANAPHEVEVPASQVPEPLRKLLP